MSIVVLPGVHDEDGEKVYMETDTLPELALSPKLTEYHRLISFRLSYDENNKCVVITGSTPGRESIASESIDEIEFLKEFYEVIKADTWLSDSKMIVEAKDKIISKLTLM